MCKIDIALSFDLIPAVCMKLFSDWSYVSEQIGLQTYLVFALVCKLLTLKTCCIICHSLKNQSSTNIPEATHRNAFHLSQNAQNVQIGINYSKHRFFVRVGIKRIPPMLNNKYVLESIYFQEYFTNFCIFYCNIVKISKVSRILPITYQGKV